MLLLYSMFCWRRVGKTGTRIQILMRTNPASGAGVTSAVVRPTMTIFLEWTMTTITTTTTTRTS